MTDQRMKPTFSLLHPTARPDGWRSAFNTWRDRCDHPEMVEYILCVDKGRDTQKWQLLGDWWQGLYQAWGQFKFVVNEGRKMRGGCMECGGEGIHRPRAHYRCRQLLPPGALGYTVNRCLEAC